MSDIVTELKMALALLSPSTSASNTAHNIIYLGAPGTGKSTKAQELAESITPVVPVGSPNPNIIRTVFHPASDYSSFVGTYKPLKKDGPSSVVIVDPYYDSTSGNTSQQQGQNNNAPIHQTSAPDQWAPIKAPIFSPAVYPSSGPIETSHIEYEFEPQAFLLAYMRAKDTTEKVALIIEEINRANCAQVFGDIFQLLDRNPKYGIVPNSSIIDYLQKEGKKKGNIYHYISSDDKITLPDNLVLIATMNTSDQSLFPMDSAFIRRWQREYVKINYEAEIKDASSVVIGKLKDVGIVYGDNSLVSKDKFATPSANWADFLKAVNWHISKASQSEDKMLGEFFVKIPDASGKLEISEEVFVNSVMSYLWDEVCKDLPQKNPNRFFKIYDVDGKAINFNYSDYFYCASPEEKSLLVAKFIYYILKTEKDANSSEVMDILNAVKVSAATPTAPATGAAQANTAPSSQTPANGSSNSTSSPDPTQAQ